MLNKPTTKLVVLSMAVTGMWVEPPPPPSATKQHMPEAVVCEVWAQEEHADLLKFGDIRPKREECTASVNRVRKSAPNPASLIVLRPPSRRPP